MYKASCTSPYGPTVPSGVCSLGLSVTGYVLILCDLTFVVACELSHPGFHLLRSAGLLLSRSSCSSSALPGLSQCCLRCCCSCLVLLQCKRQLLKLALLLLRCTLRGAELRVKSVQLSLQQLCITS
jgi:hypothetical protein